jgi:hypothetical protein
LHEILTVPHSVPFLRPDQALGFGSAPSTASSPHDPSQGK